MTCSTISLVWYAHSDLYDTNNTCVLTVAMVQLGRTPLYGDPGTLFWVLHYTSMYSVSPSVVVFTYFNMYVHTSVVEDTMYAYK